jgi:hypothetical protein
MPHPFPSATHFPNWHAHALHPTVVNGMNSSSLESTNHICTVSWKSQLFQECVGMPTKVEFFVDTEYEWYCGFGSVYMKGGGQTEAWDEDCHGRRLYRQFKYIIFVLNNFMFHILSFCCMYKGQACWMTLWKLRSMEYAISILKTKNDDWFVPQI